MGFDNPPMPWSELERTLSAPKPKPRTRSIGPRIEEREALPTQLAISLTAA